MGTNKCLGDVHLKELLEIALDNKLTFQKANPGKPTVQNFKCYTTKKGQTTPSASKVDEKRVRDVIFKKFM